MRHLVLWFSLVLGACASKPPPRAEPVTTAPVAKKPATGTVVDAPESRSKAPAIRDVIKSHVGEIKTCYEKVRAAGWRPEGKRKVAVKFTIQADGTVAQAGIAESTAQHAELEGCIVSSVGTWVFTPPEGGGTIVVTYPFTFNPGTAPANEPDGD
jgi:TonB family protein